MRKIKARAMTMTMALFRVIETAMSVVEWMRWGYSWYLPYSEDCDIVCREVLREIPDQVYIRGVRLLMKFGSYRFSIDVKGEIGDVSLQRYLDPDLVNSDNWLDSDAQNLTNFERVRPSLAVINKTQRWANLVRKGWAREASKERQELKRKDRESALALVAEIKTMRRSDAIDDRSGVLI